VTNRARTDEGEKERRSFFSREAISGVPWMIVSKLVLFVVYFGVSFLTVNGLGKEKFGVYSLMTNISSYLLVVCGLGLSAALMRYIPELAARRNRWALGHLLWKSAALQMIAIFAISMIVLAFSGPLQRLFNAEHIAHFSFYLKLACGLTALWLLKDYVATVFTSVFKTRTVALLSVVQGIIWFTALILGLGFRAEVGTVFCVQMLSVAVVYGWGAVLLFRHVAALPWEGREKGIGKRRALSFSGGVMLNSILRMVMFKYSEVFFIAAVGGTTMAGIYDLGYTLPYTAVAFIPLSLLPLFTSAFAEAYVRDRKCLDILILSYYKLLMMVSLPVAVLGAFFAPTAYRIMYSGEMDEAGRLAAAFCLVLCLPLFSMPLSAAVKAKEKVLNMVPALVLQIVVNLCLDWLLIVHFRWGAWGGVLAVLGTFVLTIPFRLMIVRRVIGGVHFPMHFFLRVLATLAIEGGILFWLVDQAHLLSRFESQIINMVLLVFIGAIYAALFLVLVRLLRVVRQEDVEDFHNLGIERLNKVFRFMVR
jgi:O-antigen/teichoic acid export membrane protein